MNEYTAKMQHSEKTIVRLAETQYNTFQYGKKLVRMGLAMVMILIGLSMGNEGYVTPMLCLFFGCVLLAGLNVRVRSNAHKICAQMNGKYPSSEYVFRDDGFRFYAEGEWIPYAKLIRLVEDRQYFYLYISSQSAYMVDRATVSGDGDAGLKRFLAERTGQKWTRPFNLLNFRFRSIFARGKEKPPVNDLLK